MATLRIMYLVTMTFLGYTWVLSALYAQDSKPRLTEPRLISIHPLGGKLGSKLSVEIQGYLLDETKGVWFPNSNLTGKIQKINELTNNTDTVELSGNDNAKEYILYSVLINLEIPLKTDVGSHTFYLISPRGISNPKKFRVDSKSVHQEQTKSHQTATTAQPVIFPCVINGTITKDGEVDFYSFEVSRNQKLRFEVFSSVSKRARTADPYGVFLDPELTLYELTGSWFDSKRTKRLAYNDEPISFHISNQPRLDYKFNNSGKFLVAVGSFLGKGSPHYAYQLHITPQSQLNIEQENSKLDRDNATIFWKERSFERVLTIDRLKKLWLRTARSSGPVKGVDSSDSNDSSINSSPILVREMEQYGRERQPLRLMLPSIIEGVISYPGDIDQYEFHAQRGQQLAFEVETPNTVPPIFNPHFNVRNSEGKEIFSNLYKRISRGFTFYLKTVEPKTLYTFEQEGKYILQIKDLTQRFGNGDFRYRLLVRNQIPHLGDIQTEVDQLTLVAGHAKKILLTTDQEEGFSGDVAISVEGLPKGVRILPGTEVKEFKGLNPDEGQKERFIPLSQSVTIVFLTEKRLAESPSPHLLRVIAQPILNGVLGRSLLVKEIPMMIIRSEERVKQS